MSESAHGPSALILTRGALEEEEESPESDTDDIDHEGEEGSGNGEGRTSHPFTFTTDSHSGLKLSIIQRLLTTQSCVCLLRSKNSCAQWGLLPGKCYGLQPHSSVLSRSSQE